MSLPNLTVPWNRTQIARDLYSASGSDSTFCHRDFCINRHLANFRILIFFIARKFPRKHRRSPPKIILCAVRWYLTYQVAGFCLGLMPLDSRKSPPHVSMFFSMGTACVPSGAREYSTLGGTSP